VIGLSASYSYSGITALVTGASSGIGAAFAESLAAKGANLILVARSIDVLDEQAARLRSTYGVETETAGVDLTDRSARAGLFDRYAARRIDLLVNNAGVGSHGTFAENPAENALRLIELNCAAVVELARAFLPSMVREATGGIINVGSTAGFQPTPRMAIYGATKAFVVSFSQALSTECRGTGVRVLAFCPGAVATNFGVGLGEPRWTDRIISRAPQPESVVPGALEAFSQSRSMYVPGALNRLAALAVRFAPRYLTASIANKLLST